MKFIPVVVAGLSLTTLTFAYGPKGHETVGAIADARLKGLSPGAKVATLLKGLSLAEAAKIPDEIKSWDKKETPKNKWFHLPPAQASIEQDLWEFWRANPHLKTEPADHETTSTPDHHWFHYVDLPVVEAQTYSPGGVGTSKYDVLHMITYCVDVLRGSVAENNPRRITKPVALILLAHYVGDIHQPLHVGAEYFSADGNPVMPDATHHGFADQGGNRLGIDFEGVSSGSAEYPKNFHGFWDGDSVDEAMRLVKADIIRSHSGHSSVVRKSEYVDYFATTEPAAWKNGMNQDMDTWATTWANEIQPIAVEAHRRVEFVHVTTNPSEPEITGGVAKERPLDEHYLHWAGETVKLELGRAGWRLAALVKELFP